MSTQLALSDLGLPRRNGELAFDAPWQSTVFALAAAVVEYAFGGDREPFRQALSKTSFYKDWKAKYGEEAWSHLEKFSGKLT